MRRFVPFLLLAVLGGCNESPTLAGTRAAVGENGALVVSRTEILQGVVNPAPRFTVIDPVTGAGRGLATWLPPGYPGDWLTQLSALTFSRDGKWMAWVRTHTDTSAPCFQTDGHGCWAIDRPSQQLFVSRVGSSQATLLTPDYTYDGMPSFSPDGQRLVFLRNFHNREQQMITMARDGSDTRAVLQRTPRGRGTPDWSPDGSTILYMLPDQAALYRVRADGSDHVPLTAKNSVYGNPAWSPDGRMIAVTVLDNDPRFGDYGMALSLLSAEGYEVARLPYGARSLGRRAAWSPDSRQIAYCDAERDAAGRRIRDVVRVLNVVGGTSRTITPAGYSDCDPIWRP